MFFSSLRQVADLLRCNYWEDAAEGLYIAGKQTNKQNH